MKSISNTNKESKKIRLGKRTETDYKYKAKVDFSQDLSNQISKLIKEKKANEIIKNKIGELKIITKKFLKKEKNLQYYYEVGKKLLFIESDLFFKDVSRYSVFRRIIEEFPEILLHIEDKKVIEKHLDIMYGLAHFTEEDITKATWDQWYEILKFPQVFKDKILFTRIVEECKKNNLSGIPLRNKIKELKKRN